MLSEIYKHLEGSDTMYDFADAVVSVRLKMIRDVYIEEIERLDNLSTLSEPQKKDYEELSGDIVAIQRVLGFYGWTEENNDD